MTRGGRGSCGTQHHVWKENKIKLIKERKGEKTKEKYCCNIAIIYHNLSWPLLLNLNVRSTKLAKYIIVSGKGVSYKTGRSPLKFYPYKKGAV